MAWEGRNNYETSKELNLCMEIKVNDPVYQRGPGGVPGIEENF